MKVDYNTGFATYDAKEHVCVGDVVSALFNDRTATHGYNAFDTAIIFRIDDDGTVHLSRPRVKVDSFGTVYTACETYTATLDMIVAHYRAYTTGPTGKVDNRQYK